MPDTPPAGALTDDDFLALVDEAIVDPPAARTSDPVSAAPDPADDESTETSTERADDDNSAAGGEERLEDASVPTAGAQPADPAAPTVPVPGVAAAVAAPAVPAPAAPVVPAPPVGVPFQYKAAGGVHLLPGALELPDGSVVIPKEARPETLRRLASERELSANFRKTQGQFHRELTAAKAARTAKDVEAEAVYKLFGDIKAMTPDERWEYFQKFDEEAPKLELQIQRRQLDEAKAAFAASQQAPEPTPEERQETRARDLNAELNRSYYALAEALKTAPGGELITGEEYNQIFQKWAKHPERLVSSVNGQDVFNDVDIGEELQFLIEAKQRTRGTSGHGATPAATAPAVAAAVAVAPASPAVAAPAAVARNAALNADRNVIPPVVAPGRVPVAAGAEKKDYKGRMTDWKRDFKLGKLDAPD